MYEKAIADLEQKLHTANQNWMDSKKKLCETEIEMKKYQSTCKRKERELVKAREEVYMI